MTYIKILTAPLIIIAGLALLTACGGVAVNNTTNNNNIINVDPCVANPFAAGCTTTAAQQLAFCRDANQTTDSKEDDCAPTVRLVCTADAFDGLCTARTQEQAEAFCGDPTKTTTTKAADCEDTITTACMNIRHTLCDGIQKYIDLRAQEDSDCLVSNTKEFCDNKARVAACDANPFPATNCMESEYADDRKEACTGDQSATRCLPTAELICGANGNPLDEFCDGVVAYYPAQKLACAAGQDDRIKTACAPTIERICAVNANPFDAFCTGIPNITATQVAHCQANSNAAECLNVSYLDWAVSFKGNKALPTAPANLNERVDFGFLAGLTTTTPVITGLTNNAYNPVTFADFNGGDARGGSVFWLGTWGASNSITNYHAGILTTTDVGAPLTSDLGGKWVGRFQALNTSLNPPRSDVDFILTVNFTAKTIYAFLKNVKIGTGNRPLEVDYEIGGDFDPTTGVITGTAEYGRDNGANPGGSGAPSDTLEEGDQSYIGGGILTGLIGQHGATGAFHIQVRDVYIVGGFVAVPKNLIVNHADWAEGLGDPETAATSRITETITDHARNTIITFTTPPSLLGDKVMATFDGQRFSQTLLGGFYTDITTSTNSVGLLPRTNMGAPLGDTFSGGDMTATWNGMISGDNVGNTDFSLEINLSDDSVEAFYQTDDISQYYHFKGGYTSTGLLTGTVNYGTFSTLASEGVSPVATSARANNGIFRGIIGQFGATAVFVSGTGVDSSTGQPTGGGTGDFAGGFAVTPTAQLNPNANFRDWVRDFGRTPPPTELDATNRKNEFLAGETAKLTTTGAAQSPIAAEQHITLTRASARFNDLPLLQSGQAEDGVAFFYDTVAANDYNYYAGILSGTDLGAPIEGVATTTAKWEGQFRAFRDNSGIEEDNVDFVLDITFAGKTGSIESYVVINADEGAYYHVDGVYNAQGVISGSVDFGEFRGVGTATITPDDENSAGILTGLIGEQGAVGAFIGGTGTKEALADLASGKIAYVGGFVAAPFIDLEDTTSTMVEFNDWRRGFGRYIPPTTIADAIVSEDTLSAFLTTASGGLDNAGLTKTDGGPVVVPEVVTLPRAGSNVDGFTYVSGFNTTLDSQLGFVGILPTTNLGAHIPISATTAMWAGQYYNSGNGGVTSSPITFAIDFSAARTIDGTGTGETAPVFDLTFDARGFISGTVESAGQVTNGLSTEVDATKVFSGTARGLIGQQGLVGGFISPTGHHGGFVADNPAFDDTPAVVSYLDWVDIATPAATRAFPLANEFVTGADTTGATSVDFINFSNAISVDTTFGGDVNPGNINDGFQIFSNADGVGDPTNFYAGILTTTNLGAPIAEVAGAVWQGHLYAARVEGAGGYEQAQFVLDFDFAMKTISAEAIPAKHESGVALADGVAAYGFTAVWDDRGVFQGTIARTVASVDSDGTLTGIIGAAGAVGVFVSDAAAPVGYAGGFVANPDARWIVQYDDWVGSFNPALPATIALSGASTGVFGGFLNLASGETTIAPGDLTLMTMTARGAEDAMPAVSKSLPRASDAMDGVVYISGWNGNNNQTFVGLLPTTNLGAPFAISDESAEWAGTYYDNIIGADTAITFDINFSTRSIGVKAGSITTASAPTLALGFNNAGVITGTVTKNSMEATARGLIGAEGLVGGFVDTTTRTGTLFLFHGGFVADNANNAVAN